jgi:outer membrane protein TolC
VTTAIPFASPHDPPLVQVSVSQKLPLSAVFSHKKDAAQAVAAAWATEVPASELDVKRAVTAAYYDLVHLEELRGVLVEQHELSEGILDAASLRYASLAGDQADVLRAGIALAEAETALEVVDLEIAAAREVLVLIMGDGRDPQGFTVVAPDFPLVTSGRGELVELALENRPELGFYDAQAVALEAKKKVAKSGNAPWLTVTAGYQYRSDTLAGLMGQDAFALGFGLSIPLLQIAKNEAAVDEVEALMVANDAQKADLALSIAEQVILLTRELEAIEAGIALDEQKVIPEARAALSLTMSAYTAQEASITEVLTAFEKLLDAEHRLTVKRGRYMTVFAGLQRACGTFEVPL